jgi:AcrR family transcriptional regulator
VKRDERQAKTRAELLEAAARIFARRGYHGASMQEIAADAGLTTGAIYSNFVSKEALFLALADQQVTQRRAEIASILDQPVTAAILII